MLFCTSVQQAKTAVIEYQLVVILMRLPCFLREDSTKNKALQNTPARQYGSRKSTIQNELHLPGISKKQQVQNIFLKNASPNKKIIPIFALSLTGVIET